MFFAFVIRLYYKESGFEYLKLIIGIIAFVYGLNFTLLGYKDTKRESIDNQIILVKTSSLGENEKKYYFDKANKTINIINSEKFSNINNLIFGGGSILLWCVVLIIFRDFFGSVKITV